MTFIPLIACVCIGIALAYGAYTDYKSRIIPNRVPVSILVLGLFTSTPLASKAISLALIIAVLVILHLLTKATSGGGDIKVYCALSFALGLQMLAFILVCTIALSTVWSLITKRRWPDKKVRIPLCTFLAPAYVITMTGITIGGVFL